MTIVITASFIWWALVIYWVLCIVAAFTYSRSVRSHKEAELEWESFLHKQELQQRAQMRRLPEIETLLRNFNAGVKP
jgi:hypothetical protein